MANVTGAYSAVEDLLIGDIPLPARHGDGSKMIRYAAKEIEAQIGHIYETPITILDRPENRPSILLLSKINNLIASGRLLLDMAAAQEDSDNHAYGMYLLKEGIDLLNRISSGSIVLVGACKIEGKESMPTAAIFNEDPESLVESFYQTTANGRPLHRVQPYGDLN